MEIKNKITIAVLTYNVLPPYEKGVAEVEGEDILFLTESFNPKCPENVSPSDPNWLQLLKYKDVLRHLIIFAGKESSGSLEIIELACVSFADKKECLYFVLCDHDLKKKEALLREHGIPRAQYVVFIDGHLPCNESPWLKGAMLEHIQSH
jgi:hypothetical protein